MVTIELNFIEIAITVFLTVFFQSLIAHMFTTKQIMRDIQRREEMRELTEKQDSRKEI